MARIGIDGTTLVLEGKGVSRYLFEYLWALKESPRDHTYFIFLNADAPSPELPHHPQFHYIRTRVPSSLFWEQVLLPKSARKFRLHLFHSPLDRLPLFPKIPMVMYLFETPDVRNRLLQSWERSPYQSLSRKLIRILFPRSLKNAARIMVSSKSTRADLETHYHVPTHKIRLVYPAANARFQPASHKDRDRIRAKLGMPAGYVLHFSSDDPRDNTVSVLQAYSKACKASADMLPLVIGGTIRRFQKLFTKEAEKLGILDRIRRVGFKRGPQLVELYQGARVYFDPSLFEGFGFQVAEAMACGLPVLASNVSSLPELVAEAALTAHPADTDFFAEALLKVIFDSALAKQISRKNLLESKKFSWKRHAEQTLQVYEEVLADKARSEEVKGKYATRADEFRPPTFRAAARRQVLTGLSISYSLTGKLAAGLAADRVQFIYFHHLFQDEEAPFRNLLRSLAQGHRLISYSAAVQRILEGKTDGRYISISFDDELKNHLLASRILGEFGISACFFVCPSILDQKNEDRIKAFCRDKLYCPPVEFLSWRDLDSLLKDGHEIGSHTMSHPRLSDLPPREIENEIASSFEILKQHVGNVKHFCWPYGRLPDFTPEAARVVFDSGFRSCASAERGCHIADTKRSERELCLRRDHVLAGWPVSHIEYFLARNPLRFTPQDNLWPKDWSQT